MKDITTTLAAIGMDLGDNDAGKWSESGQPDASLCILLAFLLLFCGPTPSHP